ncbi:MAG TPA: hypothetical protein RMI29_23645, partial [Polyangiaceae bacterium LLY-WYZ-15_(1-7)]|nr:hypothetical protein [Polyangiaceae bacterium LLY-WYZ-15_(1-7)]
EPTKPRKARELQGRVVPTFKVVGDDEEARRIHDHCADEVTRYRREHRGAEEKWVDPKVDRKTVVYPFGNHLRRKRDHVKVAPPHDDAILLRPAIEPPENPDDGAPVSEPTSTDGTSASEPTGTHSAATETLAVRYAAAEAEGEPPTSDPALADETIEAPAFVALGAELDAALPSDPVEKKKALRALVQSEAAEQREAQAKDPDHETLAERIQATDDPTDLRAQTTRRTERVSPDRPAPQKLVHLRQHPRRARLDRERARQKAQGDEDAAPRASKPPRHKPES